MTQVDFAKRCPKNKY